MNITKETRTTITLSDDELGDIDLSWEPTDRSDIFVSEDGSHLSYVTYMNDPSYEHEFPEGVEFVQGDSHRIHYLSDAAGWVEGVNADPNLDVFPVDVYEHGGIIYSLSGTGPQCDWDTARGGAAIAIPRDFTDTEQAARDILAEYTAWCNGEVYGVVTMATDEEGEWEDRDSVWGYIGYEHAVESAKWEVA